MSPGISTHFHNRWFLISSCALKKACIDMMKSFSMIMMKGKITINAEIRTPIRILNWLTLVEIHQG